MASAVADLRSTLSDSSGARVTCRDAAGSVLVAVLTEGSNANLMRCNAFEAFEHCASRSSYVTPRSQEAVTPVLSDPYSQIVSNSRRIITAVYLHKPKKLYSVLCFFKNREFKNLTGYPDSWVITYYHIWYI